MNYRDFRNNPVNAKLLRIWEYLFNTYRENGGVPRNVSHAITLLQARMEGAL